MINGSIQKKNLDEMTRYLGKDDSAQNNDDTSDLLPQKHDHNYQCVTHKPEAINFHPKCSHLESKFQ